DGHIAAIDEELTDTHQPFLVIAIFEVFERLHVFGAGPQRGPGPSLLKRCRYLREWIFRQGFSQMSAFGHHHGVNAEDALFPLRHEYFFFKKIDRPEIFQAAEVVLQSHDTLQLQYRLGNGATTDVVRALEKTTWQPSTIEMTADEHESALARLSRLPALSGLCLQ